MTDAANQISEGNLYNLTEHSNRRTALAKSRGLTPASLKQRSYVRDVKPVGATTARHYQTIAKLWTEYLEFCGLNLEEARATIQDQAPIPEINDVKRFLEWYIQATKGRLSEYVSLGTCEHVWHRLSTFFVRSTGQEVTSFYSDNIIAFIRGTLASHFGLRSQARAKGFADEVDLDVLSEQLWCLDADEIPHWRMRVQHALLLQLHFYTGSRPGALLPCQDYPDLCLKWKDFKLVLHHRDRDDMLEFVVLLSSDNMKGKKRTSEKVIYPLRESRRFHTCPISLLTVLAFADEAFHNISTYEQLCQLEPANQQTPLHIKWKANMMNEPVFKNIERGGTLMYHSWWNMLKDLSIRAGYEAHTTPYNIRRGVANKLNEDPMVSEQQRNHILGHQNGAAFRRHYQDDITAVCIQEIVLTDADRDNWSVGKFRRTERGTPIPARLPSRLILRFDTDPKLQSSDSSSLAYKTRYSQLLKEIREEHSKTFQLPIGLALPNVTKIPSSVERLGDLRLDCTRSAILSRYDPLRDSILELFNAEGYSLRSRPAALGKLGAACRTDHSWGVFYPNARPREIQGESSVVLECPVCARDLHSLRDKKAAHLLHCARKSVTDTACHPFKPKYCYRCNQWARTPDRYQQHCELHLNELDMFCGIMLVRGTVVAAGRCVFCLALPEAFGAQARLQEFADRQVFYSHLEKHLQEVPGVTQCPHPLCHQVCEFSCTADLLHHLYDDHCIDQVRKLHRFWGREAGAATALSTCLHTKADQGPPVSTIPLDLTGHGVEQPTSTNPAQITTVAQPINPGELSPRRRRMMLIKEKRRVQKFQTRLQRVY